MHPPLPKIISVAGVCAGKCGGNAGKTCGSTAVSLWKCSVALGLLWSVRFEPVRICAAKGCSPEAMKRTLSAMACIHRNKLNQSTGDDRYNNERHNWWLQLRIEWLR